MTRTSMVTPAAHTDKRMWPIGTPCYYKPGDGVIVETQTASVPRRFPSGWMVFVNVGARGLVYLESLTFRERRAARRAEAEGTSQSDKAPAGFGAGNGAS